MSFLPGGIAVLFREHGDRRMLLMRRCSLTLMLALVQEKCHYKGSVGRAAQENGNERQKDVNASRYQAAEGFVLCGKACGGALLVLIPTACLLE